MGKLTIFIFILFLFYTGKSLQLQAQATKKVVQLFGIVADKGDNTLLSNVNIEIYGQLRGTLSNNNGGYSIAVLEGDTLIVSNVSYKTKIIILPNRIKGDTYERNIFLSTDTITLPTVSIKKYPTPKQFERDFVRLPIENYNYDIARYNLNPYFLRAFSRRVSQDAIESGRITENKFNNQVANRAGIVYYGNYSNVNQVGRFIKSFKKGYYNRPIPKLTDNDKRKR